LIIQIKSPLKLFIIGHDKKSPSLTYEESNRLYQEVLKDYEGETKFKQFQKKANEYFNGFASKILLCITCHKSQGGQWNTVFIEQPYLPNGMRDYIRWLMTMSQE
jgi:hypothetical protein